MIVFPVGLTYTQLCFLDERMRRMASEWREMERFFCMEIHSMLLVYTHINEDNALQIVKKTIFITSLLVPSASLFFCLTGCLAISMP